MNENKSLVKLANISTAGYYCEITLIRDPVETLARL